MTKTTARPAAVAAARASPRPSGNAGGSGRRLQMKTCRLRSEGAT